MGFHGGDETIGTLNIKHSSVYITRSSIAVEDKKKSKNYPAILYTSNLTMHYIQLITSKD
jgi:hypothetical protein